MPHPLLILASTVAVLLALWLVLDDDSPEWVDDDDSPP